MYVFEARNHITQETDLITGKSVIEICGLVLNYFNGKEEIGDNYTVLNHLEPIVLWISILLFATQKIPEFVNPIMIFFIIATIVYTGYVINDNCTLVTPESSPHLYWSWNNDNKYSKLYYSFFIIVLNILAISSMEFGFHFASILTRGYVLSYAIYNNYKSVGSMWCFFAAFAPWIIPFIYKINLD
jgi:hypothetical protein